MRLRIRSCWWLALLLAGGCGSGVEEGDSEIWLQGGDDLAAANGSNINGSNINGSNINGSNINGSNINGSDLGSILVSVSLEQPVLGRFALSSAELLGSALIGHRAGRTYQAEKMVGATFAGTLGDGSPVTLRLQSAEVSEGSDIWRYRFDYLDPEGQWQPVCPGGASSVAVQGRWDYRRGVEGGGAKTADPGVFTLGCMGASVEKCLTAGYRPWGDRNGTSLDAYHQACVRLMRADYCGDGTSWTTNGQPINLYDGIGVQQDTEGWQLEAEWDANGARCVNAQNRSRFGMMCRGRARDPDCGTRSRFQTGTLLISEIPQGQSSSFVVSP